MSKIKWFSRQIKWSEVQDLLNSVDFVAESLTIISMGSPNVLVTFMLRQTYNSEAELKRIMKEQS